MAKRISAVLLYFLLSSVSAFAQTLTSSNLPIMIITTGGQTIVDDPKKTMDMGLIYNGPGVTNFVTDPKNNYNGKIAIEIRGSSSSSFPQKSYGFETRTNVGTNNNVSLLGMPVENDWVLHAPYTDKSLLRNVLTYQLWNEMGHYGPRTRFIELVIDGSYQGVYVLMEKIKIDNDRVDIATLLSGDISGDEVTGGYIIKVDKTTGTSDGWNSPNASPTGSTIQILYHDPKPTVINPPQKTYIQKYITDTIEATLKSAGFADPVTGYQKYMSISSWVDYLIVNEISKNVDGYRISAFFHKNKFSKGGKFKAGPVWDYNIAWWNADYCAGNSSSGWAYDFPTTCSSDPYQVPFWWSKLLSDPYFAERVRCRYQELRTNVLDIPKLNTYIDKYALDTLAVPQTRHFTKWPILGTYVWPNPNTPPAYSSGSDNEIKNLKTWITNRFTWLDNTSRWGAPCSLPVNLTSFTGRLSGGSVLLEWKTVFERDMRSYVIERSTDGSNFSPVGEVVSVNSNAPHAYNFTYNSDQAALYRLKMYNQDGTFEFSELVSIEGPRDPLMDFETYPNPFSESITFNYQVHKTANIEIELINATGITVERLLMNEVQPGHYSQTLEALSNHPAGTYLVKIRSENTALFKKVVKVNE